MRLTDLIRNHHPELREKLDSRQYAMAEKLISFKLRLNSNQKDMAKRVGVDFETYIQMENAELSIPVQDYETALLAIEKNEEKIRGEWENMNELLNEYKKMLDFNDKMQKSNMKFVESYLKFQKRKKRPEWEQDCIEFLKGAIDLQVDFIRNLQKRKIHSTPV